MWSKAKWEYFGSIFRRQTGDIHHPMVVFSRDAPFFVETGNTPLMNLKLISSELIEEYMITHWLPESLEGQKAELQYIYASHKGH